MTIRTLETSEVLRRADEIAGIFQRAFGYSDERRDHFRDTRLAYLPLYDGALTLGAFEGADLVGFVYGFDYQPEHWWPQQVGPALAQAGHAAWTEDAFELNELEILPEHQGRGSGRRCCAGCSTGSPTGTPCCPRPPTPPTAPRCSTAGSGSSTWYPGSGTRASPSRPTSWADGGRGDAQRSQAYGVVVETLTKP